MELSHTRKRTVTTLTDPKILGPAAIEAFKKLDPRLMVRNPVMFTVEVVATLTTLLFIRDLVTGAGHTGFAFQINLWLWFTVLFANFAEAVAEGRGKAQAATLRKTKTETTAKLLAPHSGHMAAGVGDRAEAGRCRPGRGRRPHPERRRGDRRRRLGQRGGDHRRVGAGDPRKRRRPFGGHRRNAGDLRLDQGADHRGTRLDVPRPDDRSRRGRAAAEDAERDRAQHPARRHDDHLRLRRRQHSQLRVLCRGHTRRARARGAVRDPDPDDHRRAALGDRHRRHGSSRSLQRARDVRPVGRGGGRRRYPASRQDRHDHPRQPAGRGVHPAAGRIGARARRCGAARLALRRNAGRPLDRRPRQGEVRHPRPRDGADARPFHPVHGAEPHQRHRLRGLLHSQGRPRCHSRACPIGCRTSDSALSGKCRAGHDRRCERARRHLHRRVDRQIGRHAARRRQGRTHPRRRSSQGHRQGRHPRTLRRAAQHGYPHGDDHRRQSAHRGRHRRRVRASTTSSRRRRRKPSSS